MLLALFTLCFGAGGVVMSAAFFAQRRTAAWPAASGEVTASRIGSNGKTLSPEIAYRYLAPGETAWRSGTAIRKGGTFSSSDGLYANEMLTRFPVGPVTVYVNPNDASDSVLVRGVEGHDWQMLSFAFPFLAVSLFLMTAGVTWYSRRGRGWVGRVRVFEPGPGVTVARENAVTPMGMASLCVAGVAFLGVFVVFFVLPRWPIVGVPLHFGLAALAGTVGYVRRRRWLREGRGDTVIDTGAAVLIPARGKSPTAEPVALKDVEGVETVKEVTKGSRGSTSTSWWTAVRIYGRADARKLVQHFSAEDAEVFRSWLTDRLVFRKGAA